MMFKLTTANQLVTSGNFIAYFTLGKIFFVEVAIVRITAIRAKPI